MKGIVLAGGSGTRLYPITKGISKQLLPVYDKPMIYYPLSVLMLAGIRDILVISAPEYVSHYENLLGDGSFFGIHITYVVQESPDGLPQAFILGEDFIGDDNVCLILGDNIFYGQDFTPKLREASNMKNGATIFLYTINDPERFGVAEFDNQNSIISIEEKPENPKSNWVVTGIYFFDNKVINIAKNLKPSKRNELEIIDVINEYLKRERLNHSMLGRGFAWLDTGTYDSLINASQFVHTVEKRQGLKIACLEEIAYRNGWLSGKDIAKQAEIYKNNSYGEYLLHLLD